MNRSPSRIVRLPPAILILLAWAIVIIVTGGVELRGGDLLPGLPSSWQGVLRFKSRNPFRPLIAAGILAAIYAATCPPESWRRAVAGTEALRRSIERVGPLLALAIAAATLAAGMSYGSFVAGGSDSYGYISQAGLWLAGDPIVSQPIVRQVPWPNAGWTFTPLGYIPTASGDTIVPTYAPGLPLLMSLATLVLTPVGRASCGPFVVVPILGALMVWLMYRLGTRLLSRTAGVAAAALLATSPIFIACLLAPMSDLPVAAFLLAAIVCALSETRGYAAWTGLTASLAVLVRPNLAPLLVVFALFVTWRARDWRGRAMAAVMFGASALPAIAVLAAIHTHLYGAPWRSGYGDLSTYFAWRHGGVNVGRYARWLLETQTPFVAGAAIPIFAWRRRAPDLRAPVVLAGAVTLVIWLSYLWYLPFETWETLRFVLGALPPLLMLALIGWQTMPGLRTLPVAPQRLVLSVLVLLVIGYQIRFAVRDAALFERWQGEARLATVGRFVDRALPRNAVVISMFHSGSVCHYAGRLTLRYDILDPQWWPRALDALTALGYRPYVVLTEWEVPQFRAHLRASPGALVAALPPAGLVYDPLAPEDRREPRPVSIPPEIHCPCTQGDARIP